MAEWEWKQGRLSELHGIQKEELVSGEVAGKYVYTA
jgi:hypothetical protein